MRWFVFIFPANIGLDVSCFSLSFFGDHDEGENVFPALPSKCLGWRIASAELAIGGLTRLTWRIAEFPQPLLQSYDSHQAFPPPSPPLPDHRCHGCSRSPCPPFPEYEVARTKDLVIAPVVRSAALRPTPTVMGNVVFLSGPITFSRNQVTLAPDSAEAFCVSCKTFRPLMSSRQAFHVPAHFLQRNWTMSLAPVAAALRNGVAP